MPNPIITSRAVHPRHSLIDKLIAYWPLSEPSIHRNDLVGNNTLTDNATVTQLDGIFGKAAQFTAANSEYLSIADNPALSVGNFDFTVAMWVFINDKTIERFPISKGSSAAVATLAYSFRYHLSTDRFRFTVGDGTNAISINANNLGAVSAATWYFIVGWYDSVADTANIQGNDGTPDSVAFTFGSFDEAGLLTIGQRGGNANFWDGRIQAVGFWKRLLSPAEKSFLYNLGKGRPYPFNA